MRKLNFFGLLVMATLVANTSHANWGNLLDSVKKKGSELIQQPLTGTTANISKPTLSSDTIINGLRDALAIGSERAIKVISLEGGYLNDPQIRVPLPAGLNQLARASQPSMLCAISAQPMTLSTTPRESTKQPPTYSTKDQDEDRHIRKKSMQIN